MEVEWRGTKRELIAKLQSVGGILSGKLPDPSGSVEGILTSIGLLLRGKIQDAYAIKSQGGTDEMGITWEPLSPVTLALRQRNSSGKKLRDMKKLFRTMPEYRRKLVEQQYQALLSVYRADTLRSRTGSLARKFAKRLLETMRRNRLIEESRFKKLSKQLEKDLPKDRAEREAMAAAYSLILRVTGRLFDSFSPVLSTPDGVLRLMPGAVQVSTNVSYFKFHQRKSKGKPRRQILPDEQKLMPKSWKKAAGKVIINAITGPSFMQMVLGPKARLKT